MRKHYQFDAKSIFRYLLSIAACFSKTCRKPQVFKLIFFVHVLFWMVEKESYYVAMAGLNLQRSSCLDQPTASLTELNYQLELELSS